MFYKNNIAAKKKDEAHDHSYGYLISALDGDIGTALDHVIKANRADNEAFRLRSAAERIVSYRERRLEE